jgi:hypothetical protein
MATPYMGLDLPVPTVTVGPAYASMLVAAFETVDEHDHTTGKGTPIPSAAIDINADLPFNEFNVTNLRTARMVNHGAALGTPSDLGCVYVAAGNLYYNNAAGQQIQLTAGGALNAASIGGIGGDYATSSASVFYTDATKTYTFWQAANTAGLIDCGAITIRDTGASANGVTLQAPSGLAASYALTFPAALPASTKIVTIDAAGAVAAVYDADNSTIEISSSTLRLKDGGVTNAKIANSTITRAKLSTTFNIASSSSVTFSTTSQTLVAVTGLQATLTTEGNPVVLMVQAANDSTSGTPAQVGATVPSSTTGGLDIEIRRNGTGIAYMRTQMSTGA